MIFPCTCYDCGRTGEPYLVEIAQVLVVSCGYCLKTIRYGHACEMPAIQDIKGAIWRLSGANVDYCLARISKCSSRTSFWRTYRLIMFEKNIQ